MKFNEKLIDLRKKQGLSQEELGNKLNVTRQTVSKWELGQTTPEMDKLAELSKLFNISVDELISESDEQVNTNQIKEEPINTNPISEPQTTSNTINQEKITENSNGREKTVKAIIIGALIIVLILIAGMIVSNHKKAEKEEQQKETFFSMIFNFIETMINQAENTIDEIESSQDSITDGIESSQDFITNGMENMSESIQNIEKHFNRTEVMSIIKMYSGTESGTNVKKVLDNIIKNNNVEDKKITVKYNEIETQNIEEIKNLKSNIEDDYNYEVSVDYNESNDISKVTIERVFTSFEINRFNNQLEVYAGTKMGGSVSMLLDSIITKNKKEERKITVKYTGIETQDETQIRSIKQKIDSFTDYEVIFDYDADGFINKATIQNI